MKRIKGGVSFGLMLLLILGGFSFFQYSLAAAHAAGTNVVSNGTIYMITDDSYRRPYTSAGAFLSYGFNSWGTVVQASAEDMALPEGSFIPPRDGKIVCSDRGTDKGTCYLITNGKRAAFVSEKVFKDLGFSFAKALTGDVSFLEKDSDITVSSDQHRAGVLVNKNGTIYLVSSNGLLGIPSIDVLKTWGYSGSDAVTSNSADAQLSQASVVSTRQGAKLSPNEAAANISPDSLFQSYIDTYPDLPTTTISAPQDGAQVIELIKKIETIPGSSLDPFYPYLTAQSIQMLNSSKSIKQYFESSFVQLTNLRSWNSKIDVYTGSTQALYTETEIQDQTSYHWNGYWVAKKEDSVWKWDLIGTLKYQDKLRDSNNPTGAYTVGSGVDDISVSNVHYTENPLVNDPNTWILMEIKNKGQTTIKKFNLTVHFNNTIIIDESEGYELQPNQAITIAVPISYYWSLNGVRQTPGQYTTDVRVGLGFASNETNIADNIFSYSANLGQKPTSPINNLVGN